MAQGFLALRHIRVRHGDKTVLEVPRIDIEQGEFLALLGPNGAGKTTLLRVMGLLHVPDSGKVLFKGQEAGPGNALAIRRRITHVFQEPLLLNDTVFQNAALGLRLRGLNRREAERRIRPWLERLGIGQLSERAARTLSGGEAQRTSLARALAVEPELLLLDEPFGALDPSARESLLHDFHRIIKETGTTTVFVTHDRDEAYLLADHVALLKDGRFLQTGSRDQVFHRPTTEEGAEMVGIENRLAGAVERSEGGQVVIRVSDTRFWAEGRLEPGARVVVCIRAEEVRAGAKGRGSRQTNRIEAEVAEVAAGMTRQRIRLNCGSFSLLAAVDRRSAAALNLSPGVECTVVVDPSAVHVVLADGRNPPCGVGHPLEN